jgi:hypothetical protein
MVAARCHLGAVDERGIGSGICLSSRRGYYIVLAVERGNTR